MTHSATHQCHTQQHTSVALSNTQVSHSATHKCRTQQHTSVAPPSFNVVAACRFVPAQLGPFFKARCDERERLQAEIHTMEEIRSTRELKNTFSRNPSIKVKKNFPL